MLKSQDSKSQDSKNQDSKNQKQNPLPKIVIIFIIGLLTNILIFSYFIFFPVGHVSLEYSKEAKKTLFEFFNNKEIEVNGVKVVITKFLDSSPDFLAYINSNFRDFDTYNSYGILEFQVKNYQISVADIQLSKEQRCSKYRTTKTIFNGSIIKVTNKLDNKYFEIEKPIYRI
ncbi:MAG: hypothetical protein N2485_00245 [bacterium]|nr:hypothetical protein [bacterium]